MKTVTYTAHAPHFHDERWAVRAWTWHPDPYGEVTYDEVGEYATRDEAMTAALAYSSDNLDTHLAIEPGHWEPDDLGDGLIDCTWVDHEDHPGIVLLWPNGDGTWDVEAQS